MKTLAFLDCPTGISGDMCLGALVSAGVPLHYLQQHIAQLDLPEAVDLNANLVQKNGIAATKVDVIVPHETATIVPPVRHLREIEQIITAAPLPERVSGWSLAIFQRLASAEGAIHGIDPQYVHFHEVGATDAIVDIVGTCLGLDWLGIDELHCAPLPTGRGKVRAAHGYLPVPAPAVLKLMEMAQVPIYNTGLQGELVTPTGAAIATELAIHFGDPPAMQLRQIGLGAGNKDLTMPNILRLWIGTSTDEPSQHYSHSHSHREAVTSHDDHPHHSTMAVSTPENSDTSQPPDAHLTADLPRPPQWYADQENSHPHCNDPDIEQRAGVETVMVLETQVDDLSPQAIGYVYNRLLKLGALDVFTQSVTMKKSRPGHLITVIAYPDLAYLCEQVLLQETTTLGVRQTTQTRHRLRREQIVVETPLGPIRMKLAFAPGQTAPLKVHPEYEDCAILAQQHNLPWREVHQQALAWWHAQHKSDHVFQEVSES